MQKRRDLVSTFVAADNAGRKVMIQHYRESALQADSAGERWVPTGVIRLVTEDGRDVRRREKGVYEVVTTRGSMLFKSDDPDAP